MKKLLQFLSLIVGLLSCNKEHNDSSFNSTVISLLIDVTDPHALYPMSEPIFRLYNFKEDNNMEAVYRLRCIGDQRLNPIVEYRLLNGFTTEKKNVRGDSHYRDRLILSFKDSLDHSLFNFWNNYDSLQSLPRSECFWTISNEIQKLLECHAKRAIVLVYCDLKENSDAFDSYLEENQELIRANPKKVADLLNMMCPLPNDLSGLEVFFVFKPMDREEEQNYLAMIEVYKILLEPRGANVTVQAQNNSLAPWGD